MNQPSLSMRMSAGGRLLYAWLVIALALGLGGWVWAAEEGVNGLDNEFLVNQLTAGRQRSPDVAMDDEGDFVVVWESESSPGNDQSGYSIQARLYGTNGVPIGDQFQVNSYIDSHQTKPSVAMDREGNFVVVWVSDGSPSNDTSSTSIQGQRYDKNGIAQGGQFQVNQFVMRQQDFPEVAMNDQGNFVVVWDWMHVFLLESEKGGDTDFRSVQGLRFNALGEAIGGEFQVNTTTTGNQQLPAVALNIVDNFVVSWLSDAVSFNGVGGQRYDAAGDLMGEEFQVNNSPATHIVRPMVAMDDDSSFVVVWAEGSSGSDPDGGIQGQRYNAAGQPQGSQFQVNSYISDQQSLPSLAMDENGNFLVTWSSLGSAGSDQDGSSIQGQAYAADGSVVGSEFQVNQYTSGDQRASEVAMDRGGNFIIVWTSETFPPGGDSNQAIVAVRSNSVWQEPSAISLQETRVDLVAPAGWGWLVGLAAGLTGWWLRRRGVSS